MKRNMDIVFGYIRRCQTIFPSNKAYYQIPKSIQYSILIFYYLAIQSKILTDDETDRLLSLFEQQNKYKESNHYSYNLLYASYRDEIGEDIFKEICHNQPHLLCLIEADNECVFGGYTAKG